MQMDERLDDFASCFSLANLMQAAIDCYKGVTWKRQPQAFMSRRLTNCNNLLDELMAGTYKPMPVEKFTLNERGKIREVKPVNYRDRVVQRCLADHVLVPTIKRAIIEDNSACLAGRGLSYAYERVRSHATACPADGWVLQFDFSNYFASIDKAKLLVLLADLIEDVRTLRLIEVIVSDDEGGLELGSHVSQLCATIYPTMLDEALISAPGVVGYHRYMDDGIVFCESRDDALFARGVLEAAAHALGLSLSAKKTHINKITQPFVFCKMRFRKLENGQIAMNVRKQQTRRSIKHAKAVKRLADAHPELPIDMEPVRASLRGYINKGNVNLSRLIDDI